MGLKVAQVVLENTCKCMCVCVKLAMCSGWKSDNEDYVVIYLKIGCDKNFVWANHPIGALNCVLLEIFEIEGT